MSISDHTVLRQTTLLDYIDQWPFLTELVGPGNRD